MKHLTILAISLLGLIAPFLTVQPTLAHTFDEFEVASYISLAEGDILIEVDITAGYLIGADVAQSIDTDGDLSLSESEVMAFAYEVMESITLASTDSAIDLQLVTFEYPSYRSFAQGIHSIKLHMVATLPESQPGTYALYYTNTYAYENVTNEYSVNGFVDTDAQEMIDIMQQDRDWDQTSLELTYTILTPIESSEPLDWVSSSLMRAIQSIVVGSYYVLTS
ncbi:MAG: hypothetical protein KC615_05645 [Anaerolineae bacterium]|nr:hypothetical protein [Anaerolineae bacterium]